MVTCRIPNVFDEQTFATQQSKQAKSYHFTIVSKVTLGELRQILMLPILYVFA